MPCSSMFETSQNLPNKFKIFQNTVVSQHKNATHDPMCSTTSRRRGYLRCNVACHHACKINRPLNVEHLIACASCGPSVVFSRHAQQKSPAYKHAMKNSAQPANTPIGNASKAPKSGWTTQAGYFTTRALDVQQAGRLATTSGLCTNTVAFVYLDTRHSSNVGIQLRGVGRATQTLTHQS